MRSIVISVVSIAKSPLFLSIIINEIGVNYLVTNGGATGTSVMNFEKVLNLGKRR
tara:strand:+ start:225 stop:389 length:165 start_codon:yes stop_codon:yes gene_type:complete